MKAPSSTCFPVLSAEPHAGGGDSCPGLMMAAMEVMSCYVSEPVYRVCIWFCVCVCVCLYIYMCVLHCAGGMSEQGGSPGLCVPNINVLQVWQFSLRTETETNRMNVPRQVKEKMLKYEILTHPLFLYSRKCLQFASIFSLFLQLLINWYILRWVPTKIFWNVLDNNCLKSRGAASVHEDPVSDLLVW